MPVVAGIETGLTKRRRESKMESGAFRGMHVVVYRGFVADDIANFLTRKKFESEIITNPVRSIAEPDALEINPEHV